jgi:uncharacterized damage-inducible protein DinB
VPLINNDSLTMPQILINNLIRQLNEIQEGSLWFDQSFKDKFDALSQEEAFTKPHPLLHSVAEHVSHILEWRKECILRYNGGKTELMNSPDDWKDNTALKELGWENLKSALYDSRTELINLIANRDDTYLDIKFMDTDYTFHYLMEGIIQHDLYHLGQIGITIKLLYKDNASPGCV